MMRLWIINFKLGEGEINNGGDRYGLKQTVKETCEKTVYLKNENDLKPRKIQTRWHFIANENIQIAILYTIYGRTV